MKQYEAVIQTLEKLGGKATLPQLYTEVMKIENCAWGTKTPFASIRRIVQTRNEIFKIRPGLWALKSYQKELGLEKVDRTLQEMPEETHSYYQGILINIGNLKGFETYSPQQDKNKLFVDKALKEIRTLQEIPSYSHDVLVKRSETVDVIWFNERFMPNSFFEVEHSTGIKDALGKFCDLRDFFTRMFIVADKSRRREFEQKLGFKIFKDVVNRVKFVDYESIVKQYEVEMVRANHEQWL